MVNGISSTSAMSAYTQVQKPPSAEDMFGKLSTEAGGDGTSITKDQLQSLIDKFSSEGKPTEGLEDLLAKFDEVSSDGESITVDDFKKGIESGTLQAPPKGGRPPEGTQTNSRYDFQDPSTITADQLQPPIDLKV
ncbi:MAG: hypothetical protein PHE78_00760 [Candidatus Gastranaerophilales bacterium]|nr:hypothetical protein [Candidatus Gastranaerophilales bacterium]